MARKTATKPSGSEARSNSANTNPAKSNNQTEQQRREGNSKDPDGINDQDETTIDMPEVSDIPGQEHIKSAGVPGAMADTTISSDDEEGIVNGKDILSAPQDDELEIVMGTEADVTAEDIQVLGAKDQDMDMGDDELMSNEGLDDTDMEGDLLNEAAVNVGSTGEDLDIPDSEGQTEDDDAMGREDEENDYYSLGGDKSDDLTDETR
ncbi:MAG: hypothetical protein H7Y31_17615 [Chitinophagaceae bacterium]|nr:hypothetical protein [Chitinophagaceae bacterium]